MTNAGNPDNVTTNDSSSFKYKSSFLKNLDATDVAAVQGGAAAHRILDNAKNIYVIFLGHYKCY